VHKNNTVPVAALLAGALVWGVIWYPYRILGEAGVAGASASFLTYFLALLPGLWVFRAQLARFRDAPWLLGAIALSAGWCNLAYVLAMVRGEVMQVLLLFFLAPLWTVLFARLLLRERPGPVGYLVIALSVGGAGIMLWQPEARLPKLASAAEWLALSAGMTFALANVLSRKAQVLDARVKALGVWIGVSVWSLPAMLILDAPAQSLSAAGGQTWILLLLVAAVIFSVNIAVQEGLTRTTANRAIVILLTELVFGAVSAYFLAGESMGAQQWAGGAMLVAATLCSGRLEPQGSATRA
jgi:drug/metabolite transporter (DMT)-like permease